MDTNTTTVDSSKLASVIEKIRKLQALAGNNTNENEIKAAAAAAEKLIQEYRISQAQLESTGEFAGEKPVSIHLVVSAKRSAWKETLLHHLINHFGCAYYISSFRVGGIYSQGREDSKGTCRYTIFGRKSDIDVVVYFMRWLTREIDSVAKIASKGQGISYSNSWRLGCASGIGVQFRQMKEAAKQAAAAEQSAAMVLLSSRNEESEKALRDSGVKLGRSTSLYGGRNAEGYSAGRAHGTSMPLRQGLTK